MNLNALRLLSLVLFLASCRNTVGADCQRDADCGGETFCATNMPGGYCSYDCTRGNCPTGSQCLTFDRGESAFCYETCTSSRDCRPGYACFAVTGSSQGFCGTDD